MQHLSKTMDCHSNVTMWFFAIGSQGGNQETRIECIYEGWGGNRDIGII